MAGEQPPAAGTLTAPRAATRRQRPVRVRFLRDTVHPDYGAVATDEVLTVAQDYADDYEELGIAEMTDDAATRELPQ